MSDETGIVKFDQGDIDVVRASLAPGATNEQMAYFLAVARKTGLDPITGQIKFIVVKKKDPKTGGYLDAVQPYVGIDGLRSLAERSGKYAGQVGPWWCGPDGKWLEVWLQKEPPAAAKVGVLRSDFKEPIFAVATWAQYAQVDRQGVPTRAWLTHGPVMLAKCAEALALRRAFPLDTSGLYTDDEVRSFTEIPDKAVEVEVLPDPEIVGKTRAAKAWARLRPLMRERGVTDDDVRKFVTGTLGKESSAELTEDEWDSVGQWVANFRRDTTPRTTPPLPTNEQDAIRKRRIAAWVEATGLPASEAITAARDEAAAAGFHDLPDDPADWSPQAAAQASRALRQKAARKEV